MKKMMKGAATTVIAVLVMNSGTLALAADSSNALVQSMKTFQASVDSGSAAPQDAIDTFAQSVATSGVGLSDVDSFVKGQMSEEGYIAFNNQVNQALNGIDPSTLSSEELGQIVGQALAGVRSEGLYWSGCAQVWTGAAIIAAAVVTGIIAIIKSKSESAITKDYTNKINDTTNSYNQQASDTRNWQTAFPNRINELQNEIYQDQNQINQDERTSCTAGDTSCQQNIESEVNILQQDIYSDYNAINSYNSRMATYSSNPGQAEIDAEALESTRDSTVATLQINEAKAIAAAPSNQALGVKLGIGAGIGAALGTFFLVHGIHDGACN